MVKEKRKVNTKKTLKEIRLWECGWFSGRLRRAGAIGRGTAA
jgi:hypothetical protein